MGNERKGGKDERKQGWAGPVLFIVLGKRRGRAFPRLREGTPNFGRVFILPPTVLTPKASLFPEHH